MAAPSPGPDNNSTDTPPTATATATATPAAATSTPVPTTTIITSTPTTTTVKTFTVPNRTMNGGGGAAAAAASTAAPHRDPPKSQRGLNKPKCSKCGNVARSRCPYQSCKSCCVKAENPCHIHVLKGTAALADKAPASSSPLLDQKSTDASPSGASLRFSSLRQLSHFNGTQVPTRAKRPMTRKDAVTLNQWRFSKLKEYKESEIEVENEAFDRYMQNVNLLEEALSANSSFEGLTSDESIIPDPMSDSREDDTKSMISGLKAQLRSDPKRADTFRQRMRDIVDQGLSNLCKLEFHDDEEATEASELDGLEELKRSKKAKISRTERSSALDDLIDKLNKCRNEEELQACIQMKEQLFNEHEEACPAESMVVENAKDQIPENVSKPQKDPDYVLPGLCRKVEIDQATLQRIDMHFSALDQADLIDDL